MTQPNPSWPPAPTVPQTPARVTFPAPGRDHHAPPALQSRAVRRPLPPLRPDPADAAGVGLRAGTGARRAKTARPTRPRLLDLFSGAGGASMGYQRAGFEVVGVDHRPQPRYPFAFVEADALEFLAAHGHEFDAIHASPPCQAYARVTAWRGRRSDHPDLLDATLGLLADIGRPAVVENVPEAPLRADWLLCGSQFGLQVRRHRVFQAVGWSSYRLMPPCRHRGLLPFMHKGERAFADAMGCDWMTNREARQAIPPAFTRYVGERLAEHLLPAPPGHPNIRRGRATTPGGAA